MFYRIKSPTNKTSLYIYATKVCILFQAIFADKWAIYLFIVENLPNQFYACNFSEFFSIVYMVSCAVFWFTTWGNILECLQLLF